MSIADHNRISALEARIAELERLVAKLLALVGPAPQHAAPALKVKRG